MFRARFLALACSLLALTLVGCDIGHAERARAEEAAHRAEAETKALKRENARLRAELEEANKLLGRDVTPVERPPFAKR